MKSLDEIGVEYQTDKSSLNHHYLSLYEMMFEPIRNEYIRILEVGVQFGNSLRTWREYFPHAEITGIDSVDNGVRFHPEDRTSVIIGNAYSEKMVNYIRGKFDIIIDDGSHLAHEQKFFVTLYSPLIDDDGVLIVEDVLDPDVIPLLAHALPEEFRYFAVDMTQGDSQVDSRLFIAKRKQVVPARHLHSRTL